MNPPLTAIRHARRRLITIGLGWSAVALLEATAYTLLALAIIQHQPPGLVLGVAAITLLATILVTRAGFFSGARLAGDLYDALGQTLNRARLSWFSPEHRTLLATLAGRGIPTLMSVPAHQLQTFLLAPLTPLFLLAGIAVIADAGTAMLIGAVLLLSLAAQYLSQRALSRADAQRHAAEMAATQATLELTDHLELLRSAAGPAHALERLTRRWEDQENALARTNRAAAPATFISALASVLPLALVVLLLGWQGFSDPAAALALILLTARAAAPLDALALAGLGLNDLRAIVSDFRRAIQAPALPEPAASQAQVPAGLQMVLEGVCYAPALHNVHATIPVGARVLVSGPTGSGKSTLLGLLMRFDDPQAGRITLGGVPLTAMRHDELAAHIAYVPQDPVIFTGTLAENVRLGRPSATDDEIADAARAAALDAVLERSPAGIHQHLGHQGTALSGGERQRVALARALLKRAPILILDEATAALDDTTEARIARRILAQDATVIIVTHRNPAIWQASQIINLNPGT
ncbi:ATP-binding cassette domain-containing protein [Kerstersia similis]|uniref:ATP-binding cassette domain-containing protein n=1 Tax=Kerstersia similis TaxID=206505 RepID=UPI0039EEF101